MSACARSLFAVAVALCLPSCVYMHEPFATEETSVADERLIGWWIEGSSEGARPEAAIVYRIRRKEGAANVLEMVEVHDPANVADARPIPIYVRRGKPDLLSMGPPMEAEGADSEREYFPCKYDVPDDRTFRLFGPDRDLFCQAVRNGELQGKLVDENTPKPKAAEPPNDAGSPKTESRPADATPVTDPPRTDKREAEPDRDGESVLLTSPAADVVRFIEKHGDKAFGTTPIVFKRIAKDDLRRRGLD